MFCMEKVFFDYTGSVFCVATVEVDGKSIAVSGGEDDKAFVWNVDDGSVRFVCDGNIKLVIRNLWPECRDFKEEGFLLVIRAINKSTDW